MDFLFIRSFFQLCILQVVCAKCSNQKFTLPFEDHKPCRVCRACYHQLVLNQQQQQLQETAAAAVVTNHDQDAAAVRPKGLLDVSNA